MSLACRLSNLFRMRNFAWPLFDGDLQDPGSPDSQTEAEELLLVVDDSLLLVESYDSPVSELMAILSSIIIKSGPSTITED
jgi:hypothetical protein